MRKYIHSIREEIAFYRRENFRLQMEDLLRKKKGLKQIRQKQIKENKARIEKLLDTMMGMF